MKQKFLAIGLAAVGILAAAIFFRSTGESPSEISALTVSSTTPEADAVIESGSESVPKSTRTPGEPSGTEVVMGIPVRKDRNCTVTRHYVEIGEGLVTEAYSCIPHEAAPNEYAGYSYDELAVMAYSDALAASTLGKRLVDANPDRSRELILRAVALEPDNLEPAMWLASQSYSLRDDSAAGRIATANAYVITNTARAMGSNSPVDWIVDDLIAAGFSEAGFALLDQSVKDDLQEIRRIQLEVFGESSVKEELL